MNGSLWAATMQQRDTLDEIILETSSETRAVSLEPISIEAPGFVGSTDLDESPLYLEDFSIGDQWFSPFREVTAEDVADFAMLTGDHDPLHSEDSNESPFGRPVAHGLLGLSMLAGLSTEAPKVATLALVSISEWQFEAPIFFGDEIRVSTQVESIQQHGRRAGRVTWLRQLLNQQGRVVQRGRFVSLVATKARARRLSSQESDSARPRVPR